MAVKNYAGESEYAGLVVGMDSVYLGDGDNTYYAVVWDEGRNETRSVGGWWSHSDMMKSVTVDATPEVVAKYNDYRARVAAVKAADDARSRAARDAEEAAKPKAGKVVKVGKGRKVPKGTTGEVFWYGAGKSYTGYGRGPMRVGFKDAAGNTHWTDANNVEVVKAAA